LSVTEAIPHQPVKDPDMILNASRSFFVEPENYLAFGATYPEVRRIIECVDPRNQYRADNKKVKTATQTAGGGIGLGHDHALAETALGEQFVTIEEGTDQAIEEYTTLSIGAHPKCGFENGLPAVLEEEGYPSDFNYDQTARTMHNLGLGEETIPYVKRVRDTAKMQHEYVLRHGIRSGLAVQIDKKNPDHANFHPVIGENLSRIWVDNYHPFAGLNRNKKAKLREEGKEVQGYHDSLRAMFDLIMTSLADRERKALRVASMITRASAAKTVLTRDHLETEFYEVKHDKSGIIIAQAEGWR